MKKFIFTIKGGDEVISTCQKSTISEAITYFATIKNLPVPCFNSLYDVKEKNNG